MTTVDLTPMKLSRVSAQGWNAARGLPASARSDSNAIADLHPYKSDPKQRHWRDGFVKALA